MPRDIERFQIKAYTKKGRCHQATTVDVQTASLLISLFRVRCVKIESYLDGELQQTLYPKG